MATPKFKMLSQAFGAPEEGITYPLGVSPEEQSGLFEEASDAALARENALPKEGYVPAGVGPAVEPSMDSPLAPMPSGLRSRKLMAEDDAASRDIPTVNASTRVDAPTTTVSTQPAVTSTSPAGPADSSGRANLPAPSSEGAGGDALGRLSLGQALTRALEGSGSIIAGRDLRSGAADTLGERMKQIEALRAKREERAMELAREDEQSAALVSQYKSLASQGLVPELPALDRLPPKQAASLIKTYGSLPGLVQRTEKTKAEIPLVEAKTGTEEKKAGQKDTQLAETKRHNLAMEAAAALAARRAARGAAEDRGVRPEALTNRLKDLNAQTKPFQEIVSSLQEADAALSALGTGQISRGAKIASKIPLVGESLVSTPELRAMQGQEGLKQSYQKLKTGLAAVGQELASFERQFGTDWQADPRKAPMAIETLKQITQDALRRTQAPFGAGTGNPAIDQMEVLSLLKNTNGLTADNPIFRPNPKLAAAAGLTPPPAASSEGKVRMISPDGRPAKIPAADVEARKAQGWKEAP